MRHAICYTHTERYWLAALGAFGFLVVNGAFAYGLLFHPNALTATLTNPLAAAFIVEALVLVGVFAYLFERWGVSRLGWGWFVFLSLLGSIAFAIPVVLLFPRRDGSEPPSAYPGAGAFFDGSPHPSLVWPGTPDGLGRAAGLCLKTIQM